MPVSASRVDPPKKKIDDRDVTLVLPFEVARSLMAITGLVGGLPSTTRRCHTDQIRRALASVGIDTGVDTLRGTLYFEDEVGNY